MEPVRLSNFGSDPQNLDSQTSLIDTAERAVHSPGPIRGLWIGDNNCIQCGNYRPSRRCLQHPQEAWKARYSEGPNNTRNHVQPFPGWDNNKPSDLRPPWSSR